MSAGATALETQEVVVASLSSDRTPRLPPEVWERVIGWVPYYYDNDWFKNSPLSQSTLLACCLVCHSWLHKSQYLLFPVVVLTNAYKANSFITALRSYPSLGQHVETLCIGPLKQDGMSKSPCFYNWIYILVNTLPPLLRNVKELTLQNLPTMHKSFFTLAPQFKSVTDLILEGLVKQSFSEIIRLVNHFPHLKTLFIRQCQWRQPAHFYSGIQHRLQIFNICTNSSCGINGPKWLSTSHSASGLTQLWIYDQVDSELIVELNQILKQCTSTLKVLTLLFENNTSLGLSVFQLNFDSIFEEVFEAQYQTIWATIDTILTDSRFKSLSYFVIWTDSMQVNDFQKERVSILQKILPKLFKKDILWWGHWSSNIAYHISSYDQRSLAWYQLRNIYN